MQGIGTKLISFSDCPPGMECDSFIGIFGSSQGNVGFDSDVIIATKLEVRAVAQRYVTNQKPAPDAFDSFGNPFMWPVQFSGKTAQNSGHGAFAIL